MSRRATARRSRESSPDTARRIQAQRRAGASAESAAISRLHDAAGNRAIGQALEGLASPGEVPSVDSALRSPSRPLDAGTRASMEARLGHDLSDVRIHSGREAGEAADDLSAQAFTAGNHIVLGDHHRDTTSRAGQQLLAHELAHVVQGRGPRVAARSTEGIEAGADQGAAAAPGITASVAPAGVGGIHRKALDDREAKPAREPDAEKTPGPEAKADKENAKGGAEASGAKKESTLGRLWSDIKGGASTIWSGMKTAGKAVGSGIATAGKAIAKGAKAAGAAIWKGAKKVGGWIAKGAEKVWAAAQWVGRQLWDKITGTFARVLRWATKLPTRVGRLFAGLWDGLTSLKPWSLAWWKSLAKVETWKDFLKWLGARAIDLAEILGVAEIAETIADFVKFNTRSMTAAEVSEASKLFGNTIDFKLVRIDERALIGPAFTKREYTSFHTINGHGGQIDIDVLMHELTHVWQYETSGAIYMAQAVHAQAWGEGYKFDGTAGLQLRKAAGQGMHTLNREQQAQVVQDFFRMKRGDGPYDATLNPITSVPATAAELALYADFVKDVSSLSAAQLLA